MVTADPRLAAELRFDLREFEPGTVLVEQLSILAASPAVGTSTGKRFSRRAAAGLFAGVLVASGTAYAARDEIVPALNTIIGHSQRQAPVAPRHQQSPGTVEHGANASDGSSDANPKGSSGDQDQQSDRSGDTSGQQSETGPGSGDTQPTEPGSGTQSGSNPDGSSSPSGTDNSTGSSGGGTSTSGDGSSGGQ